MDVKPQRPRTRVFADENAVPTVFHQKTLHSRHKSQPVLKAGLAAAGPQRFANRSAFGDLSNIANNKIRDDGALKGKSGNELGKAAFKDADKKVTVPPSREVAKATNKPLLRSTASSIILRSTVTSHNAQSKTTLPEPVNKPGPRPLRKAKTTVFKEKTLAQAKKPAIEQDLAICQASHTQTESHTEEQDPVPEQQLPESVGDACLPTEAQDEPASVAFIPLETVIERALDSDTSSVDLPLTEGEHLSSLNEDPSKYESALEFIPEAAASEAPPSMPEVEAVQASQLALGEPAEPQAPPSATIPEAEEYWDVEEDDGYMDDGYVTARSFKSIGEGQVTGNVTRTLYPHVDQAVKREIAAAKALVESSLDPAEVEDEAWDTSMVQEYGDEIFEYMRELEVRMSPNPHYMDKQTEIQWSMRSVLMDWIVQVHHRFGLLPETLFLTINLVDRFLSQKIVSLTKLQLVGATAIFVAAKYEEVDCPSVQEINFMVDNGYGVEEILKAERFMLSMLGFELGFPGPMSFLRRISKADDYDLETRTLAKYFLEITIMDERFLTCVPSFTAAGAHCLARMMLHKGNWSPAHVFYSNYTYTQLLPLISLMLECCEDPVHHHNAIFEKYLDKRYKQAAKYVQTELDNGFRIPVENINVPSSAFSPILQHYPVVEPHLYPSYWPQVV